MALGRFTLRDPSGIEVELVDLGAAIEVVRTPDRGGRVEDITLRLDSDEDRLDHRRNPHLGITVGRYANRIGPAELVIDGRHHQLTANEGPNQLHGGGGFGRRRWIGRSTARGVRFELESPSGEMGFPGTIRTSATYELKNAVLSIDLDATTDATTVCSMTNHTYWNLGGPQAETIRQHHVQIDATQMVPVGAARLPSGPPGIVSPPFDFGHPTRLGPAITNVGPPGFDHCYMVEGDGFRRHARLVHQASGRCLEVWSAHPALQFYAGGYLDSPGGGGRAHGPFAGLCLEPQHVPNAPHLEWAPSTLLLPGQHYHHRIEFRFATTEQLEP